MLGFLFPFFVELMSIVNDECKVNFVLSEVLQFIILSSSTLVFFLYLVFIFRSFFLFNHCILSSLVLFTTF